MSSDVARQSSQPTAIRVPDQLQQAQRLRTRRPGDSVASPAPAAGPGREPEDAPSPRDGILGQLETERAHD